MRNSEVKIIFVDIDNTILWHHNKHHDFDKKSLIALRKAQERYGIKVVIATARPYDSALGTCLFNFIKPDAIIACNGTNAIVDGKIIYSDAFPKEVVNNVIEICRKNGIVVEVSTPTGRYFSDVPNQYVDEYFSVFHETLPKVKESFDDEDVNALLMFAPEEFDDKIYPNLIDGVTGYRFTRCGVDIHTHDVSKADGLKAVLNYYGFKKEEAMSVGDSFNGDLPMFLETKYSIAMGNGKDELKEKAYFVTKHINRHGVKYALKRLNII